MNFTINLNDGSFFSATLSDFSSTSFAQGLNDQKINAIAFGGIVLNKNIIGSITPTDVDPNANVAIYLNNGKEFKDFVENYSAADYVTQINDQRLSFIVIGNSIVSKNMVKMIAPIAQPA